MGKTLQKYLFDIQNFNRRQYANKNQEKHIRMERFSGSGL